MEYWKEFEVIWADVDANKHMRHTAYNDYAAQVRVAFMMDNGLDNEALERYEIGPVLFREETLFFRELVLCEKIRANVIVRGMSSDGERWKMQHNIYKENGVLAATINVEGAWIDSKKRKLKPPPKELFDKFDELPKTDDYQVIEKGRGR